MLKRDHEKVVKALHQEIYALKKKDQERIDRIKELNEQVYTLTLQVTHHATQEGDLRYTADRLSTALEQALSILNDLDLDEGQEYDLGVLEIRNHANDVMAEYNAWAHK